MSPEVINNVLVFSTNIVNEQSLSDFDWLLDQHPDIIDWNVDLLDIDKVLRIEANQQLLENDIIEIFKTMGYTCQVLPD